MYSTCIFCHTALGANEAIEHFPVGRRLAFDPAKGRLWVVCRACERWNLTPLEERWEAIEECERAFSGTRLRASTDQIGLARLRDGTTLVRIGQPQRPEMAAWRYGDQFGRRRQRYIMGGVAAAAAIGGLIAAGPLMGFAGAGAGNLINAINFVRSMRTVARVSVGERTLRLNQRAVNHVELRASRAHGFELEVPYLDSLRHEIRLFGLGVRRFGAQSSATLTGDEALRAARVLLPRINASGGSAATVHDALDLLEHEPAPSRLFSRLAAEENRPQRGFWTQRRGEPKYRLGGLSPAQRLALEMSLHEEDERRAMEGELAELENRWKEAEEIAAISDDLFLPAGVAARLRAWKGNEATDDTP